MIIDIPFSVGQLQFRYATNHGDAHSFCNWLWCRGGQALVVQHGNPTSTSSWPKPGGVGNSSMTSFTCAPSWAVQLVVRTNINTGWRGFSAQQRAAMRKSHKRGNTRLLHTPTSPEDARFARQRPASASGAAKNNSAAGRLSAKNCRRQQHLPARHLLYYTNTIQTIHIFSAQTNGRWSKELRYMRERACNRLVFRSQAGWVVWCVLDSIENKPVHHRKTMIKWKASSKKLPQVVDLLHCSGVIIWAWCIKVSG